MGELVLVNDMLFLFFSIAPFFIVVNSAMNSAGTDRSERRLRNDVGEFPSSLHPSRCCCTTQIHIMHDNGTVHNVERRGEIQEWSAYILVVASRGIPDVSGFYDIYLPPLNYQSEFPPGLNLSTKSRKHPGLD